MDYGVILETARQSVVCLHVYTYMYENLTQPYVNVNRRWCNVSPTPLFNPYSAGIDFRRQNLTSVDVRFWRLKVIYHPLYTMNNFVTDKSKLPQDGAQVFP